MLSGLQNVMTSSLGPSWRSYFADFNPIPFAAASIGQVHHAVLAASVSRGKTRPAVHCECGAPIFWGSKFCAQCGRPVEAT